LAIAITPSSTRIYNGQSVTFTNSTIGIGPFTYAYTVNSMTGVTVSGNTITFSAAGVFGVQESVTNQNGVTAYSSNVAITVLQGPTITISPSSRGIDVNQSVTFTNTTTGSKPFIYSYEITPLTGVTRTGNKTTFTATGTFNVQESVTDSNGVTVYSENSVITVSPRPVIMITPSLRSVVTGQGVRFVNATAGGTAPYLYDFFVNNASGVTISNNTVTFAHAGVYNVTEEVIDNAGLTNKSVPVTLVVTKGVSTTAASTSVSTSVSSVSTVYTSSATTIPVNSSGSGPSGSQKPGSGSETAWMVAGIVVVVVAVAAALYVLRQKRSPPFRRARGKKAAW
jgi:hypothetical protein